MKLRFILSGLFTTMLYFANAINADSITVSGKVVPDSGVSMSSSISTVQLFTYKQGDQSFSTMLGSDGTFSFRVWVAQTTLFELKYKGYRLNLMLSPAEPLIQVVIRFNGQDAKSMTTIDSRENEAYNKYFRRTNNALKDELKNLRQECVSDRKTCEIKLKGSSTLQNLKMEYIRDKYKGTYAASIAGLAEMPDLNGSKNALLDVQERFFSSADLTNMNVFNTPDLGEKLTLYLDCIADTSAAARLTFLSNLVKQAKGQTEPERELISLLLSTFMNGDREDYLQTLVQWASAIPNFAAAQPVMASKIALLSGVIPGSLAPEVEGTDTNGIANTLRKAIPKNKLTLLIFWESECSHCRKAMPGFINLYQKYHPLGLGVFAASMDNDSSKWKHYINVHHLNWDNVVLPENTTAHADYFIQYTPTVVLIDQQGRIVRRFIGINDLEQNIDAFLAK